MKRRLAHSTFNDLFTSQENQSTIDPVPGPSQENQSPAGLPVPGSSQENQSPTRVCVPGPSQENQSRTRDPVLGSSQENESQARDPEPGPSQGSQSTIRSSSQEIETILGDVLPHPRGIEEKVIRVHLGNSSLDLIHGFSDPSVLSCCLKLERILPNGNKEVGDGVGVLLDSLVEFWDNFYEQCTVGLNCKVPILRHDFKETEWEACARVYLFGWAHFKYIPVLLPKTFVMSTFGHCLCVADIRADFLNLLSRSECQVLNEALTVPEHCMSDEVLDVLGNHDCKKVPKPSTIAEIVDQIAHKEIIQQPMFIIDCWKIVLQDSSIATMDAETLSRLYDESVPNERKVLKRLVFPAAMDDCQKETAKHLKQYIREADENTLKLFLRFCTACDLLVQSNKTINVDFLTCMSEFERRPVGRTCASLLQIPTGHTSFPQFRAELNGVLKSGIWSIDFV